MKVIKGRFTGDIVPLPVLGVLGLWLFVGLLYDYDFKWLLPLLLSDLAAIAMIVGIGLILFNYKKAMAVTVDEVSLRNIETSALSKNTEGKDVSQKNKWKFDWIGALVGMGVAGLFLRGMGKKYIIAAVMNGGGGEFAVSAGFVIVIVVGIIVGYGVNLIKRE